VIGGGNSAGEESVFLTRFAEKVTLIVRGDALTASKVVIDKLAATPQIDVRLNTETVSFQGEGKLSGVTLRDRTTGTTTELHPKGVFVFIGLQPNSAWLPPEINRDKVGFVLTNAMLETSMPGVFAAGDVRFGSTNQAASAAGEGATAALMIRDYLRKM
jgi:thioredoxin reductase (NADPH)